MSVPRHKKLTSPQQTALHHLNDEANNPTYGDKDGWVSDRLSKAVGVPDNVVSPLREQGLAEYRDAGSYSTLHGENRITDKGRAVLPAYPRP